MVLLSRVGTFSDWDVSYALLGKLRVKRQCSLLNFHVDELMRTSQLPQLSDFKQVTECIDELAL